MQVLNLLKNTNNYCIILNNYLATVNTLKHYVQKD